MRDDARPMAGCRSSQESSLPAKAGNPVHTGDYWMPRWSLSSGGARADPLAGHDGFSCRAIVLRSSVMRLIVIPFALNPM
jgi:hypothetical protein